MKNINAVHIFSLIIFGVVFREQLLAGLLLWGVFTAFALPATWRM